MERSKYNSAPTTIAATELPGAADNVIPSQNFSLLVRPQPTPFHQKREHLMGILQMDFYTSEMIHLPRYS